jgi:hypothetical protein
MKTWRGGPPAIIMSKDEALKQFNRSGFPFQLRIEHEIATSSQHDWLVSSREHPWKKPESASSGFIDLILNHKTILGRLVIDCKRVKSDDSRQLQWLFLLPDKDLHGTKRASTFEVEGRVKNDEWRDVRIWDDVNVVPTSLESEFCILAGDNSNRQPLLESRCEELLESVEGLAQEEVAIQRSQKIEHVRLFVFPTIVTNAKIMVCRFKAQDVKLVDGTIDGNALEVKEVPFIRFRKSLATKLPDRIVRSLKEAHEARERTVFIVNGERIGEFLNDWNLSPRSESYATQRITL